MDSEIDDLPLSDHGYKEHLKLYAMWQERGEQIAALKAELGEWIPVRDALPDELDEVEVAQLLADREYGFCTAERVADKWLGLRGKLAPESITHWRKRNSRAPEVIGR